MRWPRLGSEMHPEFIVSVSRGTFPNFSHAEGALSIVPEVHVLRYSRQAQLEFGMKSGSVLAVNDFCHFTFFVRHSILVALNMFLLQS